MSLAPGSRLGPYEVYAKLGEGGMGQVWRAKDFQLGREVALKVLPEGFAADPERLQRFEREAKLLAQLNHPNIAQIYGMEASGDTRALVMELVEGPTLAERLESGALPLNESLSFALQIAQALEEAHEKGIVHRDLKPQNIKASNEGKIKVLDFGLAKAMDPLGSASGGGPASQLAQSPTLTIGATVQGVILGTAAYMSPEQAKGMAVDKRADIWAFGVVLYEMLAGARLFAGDSVTETLADVLRREIDFDALPGATPPAVRRLLRRCLERNPRNRLHDIGDARLVLEDVLAGRADPLPAPGPAAAATPASTRRGWFPAAAGLLAGAALIGLADRTLLAPEPPEPPTVVSLTYTGRDSQPTASPDGKSIAFTSTRDGRSRIWLNQLASGEEVAVTEGPSDGAPVFSPDGNTLLFRRGKTQPFDLFRVAAVGGAPRRVASGLSQDTASFSPDGRRIAFSRAAAGEPVEQLMTIPVEGGEPQEVARLTDVQIVSLAWSPDGGAIGAWVNLRTNFAARQRIVEFDADTGERRTLYEPGASRILGGWAWSGDDAVLVSESTTQSGRGVVRLLRIDRRSGAIRTLAALRQPSLTIDVVGPGRVVADQGVLTQNVAEWRMPPTDALAPPERWWTRGASVDRQPVFTPDGSKLVFNSDRGGNLDLWELDLTGGGVHRLTFDPGDDWDPGLTPDGSRLLWSSNRSGNFEIWTAAADGSGARQLTRDGVDAENPTATPDGAWIVYASANPAQSGIWRIRADGSEARHLVRGAVSLPEVSPNGRWISTLDIDREQLRVVELEDGAEVAAIPLPYQTISVNQVGRSRWLPGTSTLVWIDFDPAESVSILVAQPIVAGRDTGAERRTLLRGTPDAMPESFAISPDGTRIFVSVNESRSDLVLVEGLPGVRR